MEDNQIAVLALRYLTNMPLSSRVWPSLEISMLLNVVAVNLFMNLERFREIVHKGVLSDIPRAVEQIRSAEL